MNHERQIAAACGYAELGMDRESQAELKQIGSQFRKDPRVLHLRLHHLMRQKKWAGALQVSQTLCEVVPSLSIPYLHAAFCLSKLGKKEEARELLLNGPKSLYEETIFYYNMACYECVLGNTDVARAYLRKCLKRDESYCKLAKQDPDLKALDGEF